MVRLTELLITIWSLDKKFLGLIEVTYAQYAGGFSTLVNTFLTIADILHTSKGPCSCSWWTYIVKNQKHNHRDSLHSTRKIGYTSLTCQTNTQNIQSLIAIIWAKSKKSEHRIWIGYHKSRGPKEKRLPVIRSWCYAWTYSWPSPSPRCRAWMEAENLDTGAVGVAGGWWGEMRPRSQEQFRQSRSPRRPSSCLLIARSLCRTPLAAVAMVSKLHHHRGGLPHQTAWPCARAAGCGSVAAGSGAWQTHGQESEEHGAGCGEP